MSRAAIRGQIVTYIGTAIAARSIQDLNQILSSFPNRIQFQVNATTGQTSRAVGVVFIESEDETRLSLGGNTNGVKRVDYQVSIQLFHHSVKNQSQDVMDDFDNCVDQLKAYLRADHRLGDTSGTIVWQGAEPSISVEYGEPVKTNGGATETWAAIRFVVTEMIHA